jgi:hypothetical protein
MERPVAVGNLAKVLVVIGISALGGAVGFPLGKPLPVAPQLLRADPTTTSWIIFVLACIYCAATLVAAFALWKMRPWARAAYLGFVASIACYLMGFTFLVRIPAPVFIGVAFYGLLCGGLYWGWIIVRRAIPGSRVAL